MTVICFVSFKGAGTDEKCLIEILASRTNQELRAIFQAYKEGMLLCIRGIITVIKADETSFVQKAKEKQ